MAETQVTEGELILQYLRMLGSNMLNTVRDLTEEELNWQPPVPQCNSIYVIMYHAATASNWWLNVVRGNILERDRPTEFSSPGTFAHIEDLFNTWLQVAEQIVPALQAQDYETVHNSAPWSVYDQRCATAYH
ncbi:MAG TPA: DinB family protein [Ktedonobacteraceae bacterium]|nr:DinB family protein [Ktedonobacteraceae bacterium]